MIVVKKNSQTECTVDCQTFSEAMAIKQSVIVVRPTHNPLVFKAWGRWNDFKSDMNKKKISVCFKN